MKRRKKKKKKEKKKRQNIFLNPIPKIKERVQTRIFNHILSVARYDWLFGCVGFMAYQPLHNMKRCQLNEETLMKEQG